jgi:hypothetical protein
MKRLLSTEDFSGHGTRLVGWTSMKIFNSGRTNRQAARDVLAMEDTPSMLAPTCFIYW